MDVVTENGSGPAAGDGDALVGDPVADVVARVRADLAERRRRGELPSLPAGETERQFDAVVEAVDASLVEETPLHTEALIEAGRLPAWRPVPVGNPARKVLVLLLRFPAQVIGLFVRRQAMDFTLRTATVVHELALRQSRMTAFLARAHLDRIRTLEYRVAQLEEELLRLRAGQGTGPVDTDG